MISKKLLAMQRLTTHLEAIAFTSTFAGTGDVNLAGKVYRGRTVFGDEVQPPFLAILEQPRQLLPETAGDGKLARKDQWQLLIQGFAVDYKLNPTDPAYELLAHVEMRLARIVAQKTNGGGAAYPAEFRLGNIVESTRFQNPIVRPPDNDVSDTAYFYMPVTFEIVTDMISPFIEET